MVRMIRAAAMTASVALVTSALLATPARAAGKYDGTWVLDIPVSAADTGRSDPTCPALRFSAKIVNSNVTGSLQRVASGTNDTVENGTGRSSAPLTGKVEPDGMLVAQWQGYQASGTLTGDHGRVVVQGQCGPRTATATRVAK